MISRFVLSLLALILFVPQRPALNKTLTTILLTILFLLILIPQPLLLNTIVTIILGILILLILLPQTLTKNDLLQTFSESGFFSNYGEAKSFLNFFSWLLIFLFLVFTYFGTKF